MKIGIFYEHQLPRPWEEDSEVTLIQDALEQCELADALGIDYVWEVEHHFLEEYSHSSAPEVFLAAVSQRTEAHPARPRHRADAAAVQPSGAGRRAHRDARPRVGRPRRLRHGRVVVGGGARRLPASTRGEARDVGGGSARRAALPDRDAVHRPRRASTSRCRRATSCPKPVQKPHPPVWVACSRRETIHLAAQHGIGALAFAFVDPEEARHWINDYYDDARERVRADRRRGQRERRVRHHVHVPRRRGRGDATRARGRELLRLLARALLRVRPPPPGRDRRVGRVPGAARRSTATPPRRSRPRRPTGDRLGAQVVQQDGFFGLRGAVGTPDQIREYLRRYEEAGVDQVIFVQPVGQEPPRAHHGEPRAVRPRGAARVHGARRAAAARQGDAARAGDRRGDGAQAGVGPPAAADADYEFPAIPRTLDGRAVGDDFHQSADDSRRSRAERRREHGRRYPASAMFERLADLETELEKLEVAAVRASTRPATSRRPRRRRPPTRRAEAGRRGVPRVPRHRGRARRGARAARRPRPTPRCASTSTSEIATKEVAARRARRAAPRAARAPRPRRRQERDRRDPRRRGRRGGQPLGRRPLPHVRALRRASTAGRSRCSTSQPSDMGGFREITFVVKGDDAWSRLKHEAGPAPGAAGAGHREPGPRAHQRGDGRGAARGRGDRRRDRPQRPRDRRVPLERARRAVGEHHRLGGADHAQADRASSSPARTRRASSRTRTRRCASCAAGCSRSSASARRQELSSARRNQVKSGGRSDKIRTYNYKENRVTDHRIGLTLHSLDQVLAGQLDDDHRRARGRRARAAGRRLRRRPTERDHLGATCARDGRAPAPRRAAPRRPTPRRAGWSSGCRATTASSW